VLLNSKEPRQISNLLVLFSASKSFFWSFQKQCNSSSPLVVLAAPSRYQAVSFVEYLSTKFIILRFVVCYSCISSFPFRKFSFHHKMQSHIMDVTWRCSTSFHLVYSKVTHAMHTSRTCFWQALALKSSPKLLTESTMSLWGVSRLRPTLSLS